jgi:tripartite-type tricarboxylate transporter receptor subunit TctC
MRLGVRIRQGVQVKGTVLRSLALLAAGLLQGFAAALAPAQDFPVKPVKIVAPFAPGGPSDILGRMLAQRLPEYFNGTPVIIENRPGAGGNIGIQQVAKAAPDGYTLLLVSSAFVINPSLYSNAGFDPVKDFTPVTLAVSSPNVLVVSASFPARDMKEFFDLVKANPGKYDYATPGGGTGPHLSAELLKLRTQLDMAHVPYNGGGPAIQAVLANQVPIGFSALPPAVPLVKSGKMRALAVTSSVRAPSLPEVPTLAESGVPDFEGDTMQLMLAPAGTPPAIVARLQAEVARAFASPDIHDKLVAMGFVIIASTPEQTAQKIRTEIDKWARVIRAGNIKPD